MSYEPFIDDPEHIKEVEGQRFIVLRPEGVVSDCHRKLQDVLRRRLSGLPVSFPARGHVTLAGFVGGTELHSIQELVSNWVRGVSPLRIQVERATSFPPPFKILYLELLKTPALFRALQTFRRMAEERALLLDSVISVDKWIFHMSLAYCPSLNATEWDSTARFVEGQPVLNPSSIQDTVEIAAYDDGKEYSGGVYPLTRDNPLSGPEDSRV